MDIDGRVNAIILYIDSTRTIDAATRIAHVKDEIVILVTDTVSEEAGALVGDQIKRFISGKFGL